MSQGNDFANYASSVDDRSTASEDVWFVAVSSDDIKQMSVDQLDEAFRLGVITANTAVWTEGMPAWAPLGEVADLDGSADESEASGIETKPAVGMNHAAPGMNAAAFGSAGMSHGAAGMSHGSAGMSHGAAPVTNLGSALFGGPEDPHAGFSGPSAGPSSFAPVTSSHLPSLGPSALGNSTGPVALNVDEDGPVVRRGRGSPVRWLLVAAGVVGAGVVAYTVVGSGPSKVAVAEKPAVAAPASHGYEVPPERGTTQPAAVKEEAPVAKAADTAKDAPIGSVPSASADEDKDDSAADAPKSGSGKESVRGSMSKALGKKGAAGSSGKSASAKGSKGRAHGKVATRATASRA
ncbi:MAG TPA: DUF4339 domain-containing protein, partial [Polyangiaceae bacterium]|nr:DUF4339 domain-containing protein [Polyangiaceae bacterium]